MQMMINSQSGLHADKIKALLSLEQVQHMQHFDLNPFSLDLLLNFLLIWFRWQTEEFILLRDERKVVFNPMNFGHKGNKQINNLN